MNLPEGLFLEERQRALEQLQQEMQETERTMQQTLDQTGGFIDRFTQRMSSFLSNIRQKLRATLPRTLQELATPQLMVYQAPEAWNLRYTYTPQWGWVRYSATSLVGYPAEPYFTPAETVQMFRESQALSTVLFGGYAAGTAASWLPFFLLKNPLLGIIVGSVLGPVVDWLTDRLLATKEVGAVRKALSTFMTRPEQMGRVGPSLRESARVYHEVLRTAERDVLLGRREMLDVFARLTQSNLLLGVRAVETFRRRFKDLTSAIRRIAQNLHMTFQDAINLMQEMRRLGIANPAEMARYAHLLRRASVTMGVSPQWYAGVALGNAGVLTTEIGLTPQAAMNLGFEAAIMTETIRQVGGERALNLLGGVEKAPEVVNRLVRNLLANENLSSTLLGLLRVRPSGEIVLDQEAVRRLLRGELSYMELQRRAAENIMAAPGLASPAVRAQVLSQTVLQTNMAIPIMLRILQNIAEQLSRMTGMPEEQAWMQVLTREVGLTPNEARGIASAVRYPEVYQRLFREESYIAQAEEFLNRELEQTQNLWRRFWKRIGGIIREPFRRLREWIYGFTEEEQFRYTPQILILEHRATMTAEATRRRMALRRFEEIADELQGEAKKVFEQILETIDETVKNLLVDSQKATDKVREIVREVERGSKNLEEARREIEEFVREVGVTETKAAPFAMAERRVGTQEYLREAFGITEELEERAREMVKGIEKPTDILELLVRYFGTDTERALAYLSTPEAARGARLTERQRALLYGLAAFKKELLTPLYMDMENTLAELQRLERIRKTPLFMQSFYWFIPTRKKGPREMAKASRELQTIMGRLGLSETLKKDLEAFGGLEQQAIALEEALRTVEEMIAERFPQLKEDERRGFAAYLVNKHGLDIERIRADIRRVGREDVLALARRTAREYMKLPEAVQRYREAVGIAKVYSLAESARRLEPEWWLAGFEEGMLRRYWKGTESPVLLEAMVERLRGNQRAMRTLEKLPYVTSVQEYEDLLEEVARALRVEKPEEMRRLHNVLVWYLGTFRPDLARRVIARVPQITEGRITGWQEMTPEELERLYGTEKPEEVVEMLGKYAQNIWELGTAGVQPSFLKEGAMKLAGTYGEFQKEVARTLGEAFNWEAQSFREIQPQTTREEAQETTAPKVEIAIPQQFAVVADNFNVAVGTFKEATGAFMEGSKVLKEAASVLMENIDLMTRSSKQTLSDANSARRA